MQFSTFSEWNTLSPRRHNWAPPTLLLNPKFHMEVVQLFPLVLAILAALTSPASAAYRFGVGDGLALVLFVVIGIVGVCALLGWIARKRSNS